VRAVRARDTLRYWYGGAAANLADAGGPVLVVFAKLTAPGVAVWVTDEDVMKAVWT
jgi:hypothetical protein